ncbi:MAG: FMN-binding protein [Treponema sp.]|nr:FMN-binding protein [Treponema sp.]
MKRRKIIWLGLFLLGIAGAALVSGCLGSASVLDGYRPGVYEGSGQGYRGPIYVRIQVSRAGIEDIVIVSHNEGAFGSGGGAMEELLEQILESGSTELDVISGATFSSRGFLEAVEDALDKAAAAH